MWCPHLEDNFVLGRNRLEDLRSDRHGQQERGSAGGCDVIMRVTSHLGNQSLPGRSRVVSSEDLLRTVGEHRLALSPLIIGGV